MKPKEVSFLSSTLTRLGIVLLSLIGLSGFLLGRVQAQGITLNPNAPDSTVKLIFIHHSTGQNWLEDGYGGLGLALSQNNYFVSDTNYGWGPGAIGDRTDIPDWMDWFRSVDTPAYMSALYTENGQQSSYTRILADPGGENEIVLFKSCFPNSALSGNPNDPPSPDGWLTVGHAKYVYNQILQYFGANPEKLFIVITAPPLSDPTYGANARAFNQWLMNDWLNENNYTLQNVAVFDFYNVLTGPDNHHRYDNHQIQHIFTIGQNTLYYPSGDDHPSQTGSLKATDEFIELLNIYYHRWTDSIPPVPNIGGCDIFPANNIWNTRVDTLPVHGRSDDWVNTIGRSSGFHMDFGSGTWDGGPIGIPYNLANAGTPRYILDFYYPDESDPGLYPIPAGPLIEYGSDHHILIVDSSTCTLYEIYDASYSGGTWHGGSGATWNLGSNALRPAGWTSADAAGLPILPGLARYGEVAGGKINHALRFTATQTNGYIWPARHLTSDNPSAPQIPPMGARFRLKASFDTSGYPAEVRVILHAMKTYGIILADNGADWYVSGAPDERWDNDMLHRLDDLTGNDFEAVDSSGLMVHPDSGAAQSGGLICYTLTLNSITGEGGDIHASPTPNCHGNAQYPYGTVVTLTARANAGYCFVNWSGDATGDINPTSVTMNANRSVTAIFRAMPMLIEPANTATTGSLRPTFDWNDYSGATRYTIQISQNNTFTSLVTNVTIKTAKSNYTPTKNLPAITTYYWRVMARLPDGTSPWSEVYSFTPAPPPSVPTLVTPKRNTLTTGYRPRLDWNIVSVPSGTTFNHYQVQVDDNSNFSSPVVDASVPGLENHEYTVATDLNPHTKYYWRVRSSNSAGYFSSWPKKAFYFRTPPSQPVPVGPVGGEVMTGQMSTFD